MWSHGSNRLLEVRVGTFTTPFQGISLACGLFPFLSLEPTVLSFSGGMDTGLEWGWKSLLKSNYSEVVLYVPLVRPQNFS